MQGELIRLLAERLALIGVSRRQLNAAADRVRKVNWRRLPLYSDLQFEAAPIMGHLRVPCELDLESFVDVYEEFTAGYLLTSQLRQWSPLSWLRSRLRLTENDAAQLFSDGMRVRGRKSGSPNAAMQHTVALAALADYTFGASSITSTAIDFIVQVDKYRFGVDAGRPVTNLGARGTHPKREPLYCKRGLEHYARHEILEQEDSMATIFSQLHALALANPSLLNGESDGFILALHIARWRARTQDPARLAVQIIESRDPNAFRQALRLASGFENFRDPHAEMKALLVPAFVSQSEFIRLFGYKPIGRVTPQRAQQWRIALDNLAETITEE